MPTAFEQSDDVLSIRHSAGRVTSITVWLRGFMIATCFVAPTVLTYNKLTAPSTKVFDCDRGKGSCIESSENGGESWTIPIGALRNYSVYRSGSDTASVVARRKDSNDYRSGEVHGSDIEALERGVARLHAFVDGSEPTLRVELPNGSPAPPWGALVFMVAIGALVMFVGRQALYRSWLVLDRRAGTGKLVGWRASFLRTSKSFAPGDVKEVVVGHGRTLRGSAVIGVSLVTSGDHRVFVMNEYDAKGPTADAAELAKRLAAFLNVPSSGA